MASTVRAPQRWRSAGRLATLERHAEALFPQAPAPPPWSARSVLFAVGAVIAGTLVSLGRTPGFGALDTMWLEDGSVFLTDAAKLSTADALTTPYSGYFHLLPRLLAEVSTLFPIEWAAAVLAIEAAAVTSLLGLAVYFASRGLLVSPLARVLVSVPVVLVPAGYTELPNAINELRWPLMYAVFWMALWVPTRRAGQIIGLGIITVAALTDNVVVVFVPLVLVRFWVRRDRYSVIATTALIAGISINLTAMAVGATEHERIHPRINPAWAVSAFVLRPVPQGMLGERFVGISPEHTVAGLIPVTLGWLVLAAAVAVAVRRGSAPAWPLAVAAGFYCIALYVFVLMIAGVAAPRYSGPAALLIIACVVALLLPARETRVGRPRWVTPLVGYAVLLALISVFNYQGNELRGQGPQWSAEVAAARERCATSGVATVDLQVTPARMGWYAEIPCEYLRNH